MSETAASPSRSGPDWLSVALGAVLVVVSFVILGHAVIATTLSVVFVGWLLLLGGAGTFLVALFQLGRDGFWSGVLGGALMFVLGLMMLRNTDAAVVTLTLVAGAMFFATGVARLAAAIEFPELRVVLVLSGLVSTLLGIFILFNLLDASFTLLGVLLGIEVLFEGIALMLTGREPMADRATRTAPA